MLHSGGYNAKTNQPSAAILVQLGDLIVRAHFDTESKQQWSSTVNSTALQKLIDFEMSNGSLGVQCDLYGCFLCRRSDLDKTLTMEAPKRHLMIRIPMTATSMPLVMSRQPEQTQCHCHRIPVLELVS